MGDHLKAAGITLATVLAFILFAVACAYTNGLAGILVPAAVVHAIALDHIRWKKKYG